TRSEENHNGFAKASDERMANIQRKFEPNFVVLMQQQEQMLKKLIIPVFLQIYNKNLEFKVKLFIIFKEFRRPGEPASEAANEIQIDTTQPDGHVIETEVLPGNEEIQNVVDLLRPPTAIRYVTNNDATAVDQEQVVSQVPVLPKRKRKRGGTTFIPKRPKKRASSLSPEKRSSTQPPTDNRAPRAHNNNTSASQPIIHQRQRLTTPDNEEREEEEEEDYHLRPRRSVRQRGKQVAERLKQRLPQTDAPSSVTSTRPRQPQRQQPTSERRYDPFEKDSSEAQQDIPAASNRQLGNQQIITIEYPIQDEQLKDDFEHIIPQENPPQIEQACATETAQLQQPPGVANPFQVEQVALQGGRHHFDPTVSQCAAQNYLNQIARLHDLL
uniref:Uncharacterized protein n=1 Tax=Panagrolaimus sp. ES5 TaxID=591445 RepID=A0AC34F8T7_9BILA